ncbi:hypothetical protein DT073_04070 [Microbacterium sp. ABRD28]|nr:hypothetical protein [Microbacterium sp. ABRD28]AZC12993.1 hypothetical protein DT073_04070 [Microbacterium sp. ABRD28]
MHALTPARLRDAYEEALKFDHPLTSHITTDQFSRSYPRTPEWVVGPFQRDDALTFRQASEWPDPADIGWRNGFVFNPSILNADGELHLFYRASPRKESMSSRIGHAVYTRSAGWIDDPANPVVISTFDNEGLSVEDPKVYRRHDGLYVMFYNGIWATDGADELTRYPSPGYPLDEVGCDIMVATSADLQSWTKHGLAVPYEISRGWAKGAVIPRSPRGDAVRVGGEYIMYLSEGCNGTMTVGRSTDLLTWEFRAEPYLDLTAWGGSLFEVATAVVRDDDSDIVLDFFYNDADGQFAAGQARYSRRDPFRQRELNKGGALAWGGFAEWDGALYFAQGWDAPEGSRELYFYRETDAHA